MLRVAFSPCPPWKVLDEDGSPRGVDVVFLHTLADRLGLGLEHVQVPFARGLQMIESGDVDMMTGVLRRPRRANYAHFLVPPYRSRTNKAFYVLKGNEKAIGTYDDLRSLTIGTQIGGKYFARFDSDAAIEKVAVTDTERNIKMLIAGRIDAYVMSEEAGDYRLASFGLSDTIAKAEYRYCKEQNVFMVLSKRSPHASRLDEFNRELKALLQQHEYERIKEKVLPGIRRVP